MKLLEQRIRSEGKVYPGNVLKVGSFLNHQIDVDFMMEMGKEIAKLYENSGVNKIVTIESSGIAIAVCAASFMHVPVVFAKKSKVSKNISGEMYSAGIHSYTHGNDYTAIISTEVLSEDDNVLIVDDFLANGSALEGLMDIVGQSGAKVVGAAIAIEKGFQHGGDELRKKGVRIESLAIVEAMEDSGAISFRE